MYYCRLNLQANSSPFNETDIFLSGCQAPSIVVEAPANYLNNRARVSAFSEVFTSEIDDNCSLDWLSADSAHQGNGYQLANGLKYYGRYFPAASGGHRVSVVSMEHFECAHCALLKAREILLGEIDTELAASVLWADEGCEPMAPISRYCNLFDETGGIVPNTKTTKLEFSGSGCGACGFPGHNRATCTRPARHYAKVGVEIEGRFLNIDDVEEEVRNAGLTHCGDGSIYESDSDCSPLEIQTIPGSLVEQLRQLSRFYPDETDGSCGMHVHVSFNDPCCMTQLATPEFVEYFTQRWRVWGEANKLLPGGHFFSRLNGHNEYCVANTEHDFINPYHTDRYRQLNFSAWQEHETLECRLLPMFKEAKLAYSALVELLSIYEDWLGGDCPAIVSPHEIKASDLGDLAECEPSHQKVQLDVDQYIVAPDISVAEIDIIDLPPVPPGMVRVCTVPSDRLNLEQTMMWRAA